MSPGASEVGLSTDINRLRDSRTLKSELMEMPVPAVTETGGGELNSPRALCTLTRECKPGLFPLQNHNQVSR
jgi:hypothetical protein